MIRTYRTNADRRTRFEGSISDMEILCSDDPLQLAMMVKQELVARIVDRVMEKLSPTLDVALENAFRDLFVNTE